MEKSREKNFKWRGMMTLLLVLAVLVDIVSGVILYITPPGRFANWTNWTLWGLNKHEWGAIHTIFSYLLVLVLVGHLYFNWRVLVHFVWSKIGHTLNLKKELAVASLIILFVFMGTLWDVQPFSAVMNFGEKMKLSWEKGSATAQRGGGYGRRAYSAFDQNENQSADRHGTISQSIHQVEPVPYSRQGRGFGRATPPVHEGGAIGERPQVQAISYAGRGRGFGRMTIDILCSENRLSLKEGLSRLKANGIDAGGSDRIRDLATRSGKTPNQLFQIIRGEGETYPSTRHSETFSGTENNDPSTLKGRDFVRLGNLSTLTGTLVQKGDEWGLKVGDTVYDIHLGPSEYRSIRGFHLKDGDKATIRGFVYKKDLTIVSIETGGKSITLRDETGRPAWAGAGRNTQRSSF